MMLHPRSIVIGTAGHIDHGKTTLVRALTGIDADRLPEEKRRGITIDLGFASTEVETPDGAPLRISFVDVPGHNLFIRNMLAGTGCVPAVMLIIAADEGIKPQTIEHLAICELLGISHGIVVITKIDAVNGSQLDEVTRNIDAFLKGTFFETDCAPILPVSARSGAGLEAVRTELLRLALRTQAGSQDAVMRLPIDRSFVMKGFGAVVTGTLLSGTIREGKTLMLEPGARMVRARGLQTHGHAQEIAQAGSRVAVNLSGIDAADIRRGQVLVAPQTLSPVESVDVEVSLLATAPPLKHRARVHFHAFTAEVMASVSLYRYEAALPASTRLMRLKFEEPIVLVPGDRFVLRQPEPVATIGGGRVLDAHPEPHLRKVAALAWLEQLKDASVQQQIAMRIGRRKASGIRIDALARETGITAEAVRRHLDPLLQSRQVLLVSGDLLLNDVALRNATDEVMDQAKRGFEKSGALGMKSSELRSLLGLTADVFEVVLNALVRDQKVLLRGETVWPAGARSHSPQLEEERLAAISQAYHSAGLAAPSVVELGERLGVANAEMRRLITLLLRNKTVVRMGSDDLFIHVSALNQLVAQVASLRGSLMDVSRFKELTGLSRKYAIPLLEYLDRERVTRKQGDRRLVL